MAVVGTRVPDVATHPHASDVRHVDARLSATAPRSTTWVAAALVAFVIGFTVFWPRVLLIVDEDRYVSQAVAFAGGATTITGSEVLVPPTRLRVISDYPPGTSLLQAPLVWIGGWRAAGILSVVSLIVATLLTARWIRDTGRDPRFALFVPGFIGTSFFARVGMSDVPATALVALSLYLLSRALGRDWRTSFAAGFSAATIVLFREPVLLLVAPFVAGALLRASAVRWALIAGISAGVMIRLGISMVLFDSPFYLRDPGYGISLSNLQHTLPLYALVLLAMIPAGALLPFLYRGPRRAEMATAVALYAGLFLLYSYDPIRENGLQKGVLLAARFMAPLTPLIAMMAADVWPRVLAPFVARAPRASRILGRALATGAVAVAFLVHPLARRQEGEPLEIVKAIYANTTPAVPIITNSHATLKYLSPAYGPRKLVLRYDVTADSVPSLSRRLGVMSVVLLDRRDSEKYRAESTDNDRYLADVGKRCELRSTHIQDFGWARLRVFQMPRCT